MRSRNGDHSLLRYCSALIAAALPLWSESYYIGYRADVSNALLVNETLHVSRAMSPCAGTPGSALELPSETGNLAAVIENNRDRFETFMRREGYRVTHRSRSLNYQNSSRTTLTFPTHCFEVEFKPGFAKIALIK